MKKKSHIYPLLLSNIALLFALLLSPQLRSQTLDVGVFGGGSYYLGDINPSLHFVGSRPGYGAIARFNHKERWSFRVGIYQGKLQADDAFYNEVDAVLHYASGDININDPNLVYYMVSNRGLSFQTDITELSFLAELNFFPYFVGSKRNTWTPYIFAGAGLYLYESTPISGGPKLKNLGTEGQGYEGRPAPYGKIGFSIPFGLGFKFSLGKRLGLGIEWGMRKTFNDYIDDISGTYYKDLYGFNPDEGIYYAPNPDHPSEIVSFPITDEVYYSDPTFSHKKGEKRGDTYNKDWYAFYGITLTYKINIIKNDDCRDFSRGSYY